MSERLDDIEHRNRRRKILRNQATRGDWLNGRGEASIYSAQGTQRSKILRVQPDPHITSAQDVYNAHFIAFAANHTGTDDIDYLLERARRLEHIEAQMAQAWENDASLVRVYHLAKQLFPPEGADAGTD